MRRISTVFILLIACALALAAGCKTTQGSDSLLIWSGLEAEHPTLLKLCEQFQKESGIKTRVVQVPFQDLRNKFLIAAPADLGPDVVLGPNDWIGVLGTAQQIQPIPPGVINEAEYEHTAIEGIRFQKHHYAVPLCMESIALFRNKEFVPEACKTMPELIQKAQAIQAAHRDKNGKSDVYGLYFEIRESYFSLPFIYSEGGYLIGQKDGDYNPMDIGLSNAGAIKGCEFLRDLTLKDKLVPIGSSESVSRTLFVEHKAAFILNGPWFLRAVKGAQPPIDYAIDTFPAMADGGIPRPIVSIQGMMFNKDSKHPEQAKEFMTFMSQNKNMAELSLASGRPPAKPGCLDLVKNDADIMAFYAVASQGVAMPTHPALGAIWDPLKQSLELIAGGQAPDVAAELQSTKDRIDKKIELMME